VIGGLPRDGDGQHFNRYVAPNMFAGSILNLEPEAPSTRPVRALRPGWRPRSEGEDGDSSNAPRAAARSGGARLSRLSLRLQRNATATGIHGLLAAYYLGSDQSDHSREMPPRVQPGDTILVHAGLYKDNRFVYSGFDRTIAAYGTPV
jgi:hypothetical protein